MNNKLEEWKEQLYKNFITEGAIDRLSLTMNRCCIAGAKDAINAYEALGLPVKFARWVGNEVLFEGIAHYLSRDYDPEDLSVGIIGYNLKDLYKYWVENIYKPE